MLMISLTSCGSTVFRTNMEIYCPTIKEYPEDFGYELTDELVLAEENGIEMPLTIEVIDDYRLLREKIEACKEEASEGVN